MNMKMSIHILQFENGKIVNTDIVMQRISRVIHFLKISIYHLLAFHVLCIFLDIFKYNF